MTLPTDDDFTTLELSTSELEAISAGLIPRFLGPPVVVGGHQGGAHQPPHCSPPPRYYPGGSPNAPVLHPIFY
jgi:hypothetical protein